MKTYKEVKTLTDRMSSGQYNAWRLNPENRQEVVMLDAGPSSGGATKAIYLSQPQATQPTERYAVIRPCAVCGADAAVASDLTGPALCSAKCIQAYRSYIETATSEFDDFVKNTPAYYQSQYNDAVLLSRVDDLKIGISEYVYQRVFVELTRAGKLLPPVSLDELLQMSPADYQRREQLDPDLGGHKKEIEKGALKQGQQGNAQPSGLVVGTVQPNREDIDRANKIKPAVVNRHTEVTQTRNGVYITPDVQTPFRAFRNGRPVGA